MSVLFKNADIVTMNASNAIIRSGYVLTDGKIISYIGKERPSGIFDREIDCTGKVLMPGLVNAHTHIPMTLMRGYAGGHDLQTWLNDYIFPAEDKLDGRCVKAGSLLALAEMISTGTTSIAEMYYFCGDIAESVVEAGISANISRSITVFAHIDDPSAYPACRDLDSFVQQWKTGDDQILPEVSVHAEYTSFSCPEMWHYLADYASANKIGMQVHISETESEHRECIKRHGKTPLQILDDYGVWNTRSLAAHCVWCSPEDFDLMQKRRISPVHNPSSNLKLGSGVADLRSMRKSGLNICLGTDGASSNNSLDLLGEVRLTALIHSGVNHDPMAVSPTDALRMATVNGGIGLGRKTGVIEVGYMADIILLDFTRPTLTPCHDILENIVYAGHGGDVCLTMARGKVLYENGEFLTLDLDKIRYEVNRYAVPHIFG